MSLYVVVCSKRVSHYVWSCYSYRYRRILMIVMYDMCRMYIAYRIATYTLPILYVYIYTNLHNRNIINCITLSIFNKYIKISLQDEYSYIFYNIYKSYIYIYIYWCYPCVHCTHTHTYPHTYPHTHTHTHTLTLSYRYHGRRD